MKLSKKIAILATALISFAFISCDTDTDDSKPPAESSGSTGTGGSTEAGGSAGTGGSTGKAAQQKPEAVLELAVQLNQVVLVKQVAQPDLAARLVQVVLVRPAVLLVQAESLREILFCLE